MDADRSVASARTISSATATLLAIRNPVLPAATAKNVEATDVEDSADSAVRTPNAPVAPVSNPGVPRLAQIKNAEAMGAATRAERVTPD